MNRISSVLLCILPSLAFHVRAQDENGGRAIFSNGDQLSGTPGALTEDGLAWTAEHLLHQPSTIRLDSLLEVQLQAGDIPERNTTHQALLSLTNGDTIRGELVGLDDEYVTLKTWYGGELRINRLMATDLEVIRSEHALYSGPDSIENWTVSGEQGAWGVDNGQLLSRLSGSVAREIELPSRCHIHFDLAWRSNLKFHLILFSDEGDTSTPGNCYDLVCQRRFVYLRKKWKGKSSGTTNIGQPANIRELADQEKVGMDFYIDRATGTVAFYVDGRQAQVWSDEAPKVGSFGNWLHFVAEEYPLRISNIRASVWKGDLPENSETGAPDEPLKEEGQVIALQNNDTVVGEVGAIENGTLTITSKHGDIPIPVQRIRSVNIGSENFEEPIRKNGDIHGWLREGGRITFRLDSFRDGTMNGYSQAFGEAIFDLKAFSKLEFNIYNEDLDHLRGGSDW